MFCIFDAFSMSILLLTRSAFSNKIDDEIEEVSLMDFNFDWNYISSGAPYVTISELGLAFNYPAICKLGTPDKVILGFDEANMAIGIKAYKEERDIKSYEFASRIRNNWIRIGCKDFVKYLSSISGISFSPAKKYLAEYDKVKKILFITVDSNGEEE